MSFSFYIHKVKTVFTDFTALLFPELCEACGGNLLSAEHLICTKCRLYLPHTDHILNIDNALKVRFQGRVNFQYAMSLLKYNKQSRVQKLMQGLKYHGKSEIGHLLGVEMSYQMKKNGFSHSFDCILPVPIHARKLKIRGYNQASMFAEGLNKNLKIEILEHAAVKIKHTSSQTKFSGSARWNNVKDVFKVIDPLKINQKRVLIVDDVVTTGATIESLANEILKYQPLSVSLASIAYANKD